VLGWFDGWNVQMVYGYYSGRYEAMKDAIREIIKIKKGEKTVDEVLNLFKSWRDSSLIKREELYSKAVATSK